VTLIDAINAIILVAGILVVLGVASSKLSARLGVPVLVLFLLLGMLAGSEGIGGIEFTSFELAYAIGTLALALILFDGGLGTSMSAVRVSWKPAVLLATWGVFITAIITALAASWVLGLDLLQGLLLGSIVGSTDAAAVFGVLRSGGVGLPKRIAAVLEVESASNDPMAIFLTVGCIEVLLGNVALGPGLLGLLASQFLVGAICGLLGGMAVVWVVNRIELSAAGLYPVLVSACCMVIFGAAAWLGGSGFLAVYLAGIVIGNRPLVFQRGIRLFHDATAWFSQIVMFVVLGLLSFPSRLLAEAGDALLITAALVLVARPLAVLLSGVPFWFTWKESAFISWVGLKGAVPITLATFPLMYFGGENVPHQLRDMAPLCFNVVFFIVVISAAIQGGSLTVVARWLGLERPRDPEPPVTLEISSLRHVNGEIVDYSIGEDSRAAGKRVRDLALPEGAVIAMIARGDQIVPPQGSTKILPNDHVILVLRPGLQPLVSQVFAKRSDVRSLIPEMFEFPLRGSTTVGTLEEFYGIHINAPPNSTLTELLNHELGTLTPAVGESVQLGPLMFSVQRVGDGGQIEMVSMAILAEEQESAANKATAMPAPVETPALPPRADKEPAAALAETAADETEAEPETTPAETND